MRLRLPIRATLRLSRRAGHVLASTCLLLFLAAACGNDTKHDEFPPLTSPPTVTPGQKVNVVASTTQIADFARIVGGDRINLTDLVKPGVDPHDFEPTPQDVQKVTQAHLIAINGVGLEQFMDQLLEQAGGGKPVAVLSRGVKLRKGTGDEAKTGDPHVWLNPQNAQIMVDNLADALAKVDPTGAAVYRANADAYKLQLDDLDRRIEEQINTIPKERRKVVTNHDALGYYLDRYGITFVGAAIPSLETHAAPSARQIAETVRKVRKENVPAVFTESSLDPRLEEQIAREAGVKVVAMLYADSLGPPGSPAATYLAMMEHNTRTIVDALR